MSSSWVHGAAGAAAFALVLSASLVGIATASSVDEAVTGRDLEVLVQGPHPFLLATNGGRGAGVSLFGAEGRVRVQDAALPGLSLRTWSTTYAHRWEREVSIPVLGDLRPVSGPTCGYALTLSQAVLDTRYAAGLASMLLPHAQAAFARVNTKLAELEASGVMESTSFRFDEVSSVALATSAGGARLQFRATIAFRGDEGVAFTFVVALDAIGGVLRPRLVGKPVVEPSPQLRVRLQRQVASDHWFACTFVDCEGRVDAAVQERGAAGISDLVDMVGGILQKATSIPSPLPGRQADTYGIVVPEAPTVGVGIIALPLCLQAQLSAPLLDASVAGYVALPEPVAAKPFSRPTTSPWVGLSASPGALNHLLYLAWQTNLLGDLGRSSAVTDALPADVRSLAFDVTGLEPRLPPQLAELHAGGATLSAFSVKLGNWNSRAVVGHARLNLDVAAAGSSLIVGVSPVALTAGCEEEKAQGMWQLTPCLSDLLPAVRESALHRRGSRTFEMGDVLMPFARARGFGLRLGEMGAVLGPAGLAGAATVEFDAR